MKITHRFNTNSALRGGNYFVLASLLVPLAGCGGKGADSAPPPSSSMPSGPPPGAMQPAANKPSLGLSTKQKVVLLAGAAALYYYYQKSKKETAAKYAGQNIQYYLSKNGGIYYRDPQSHQAIFVTAPTKTVEVPPAEAQQYAQIQGYNNQTTGNGLDYYFKPAPGGGA